MNIHADCLGHLGSHLIIRHFVFPTNLVLVWDSQPLGLAL